MCFNRILHNLFAPVMHDKRLSTLKLMISSSLETKTISVTNLGRGINLPIQERSCIRRSDRFIGNSKLHAELDELYRCYIYRIIYSKPVPIILVDWSQVPNTKNHILRASLAGDGRGLTLYEEVYEEAYLNNSKVELAFLDMLKKLLPNECKPIIVTDAGYKRPWFKKVLSLGWDYIGRVRSTALISSGNEWISCKSLIESIKIGLKCLGKQLFCKTNSLETNVYLFKQPSKNRKSVRRKPGGKRDEKNYKRSGKEGWLLVSSISSLGKYAIKKVVNIYKKRMQIEQGFRDLKSPNFGFGMRDAHSWKLKRIRILLFIAMIATWIAWLLGACAEKKKLHYTLQVNSLKTRRVLSLVSVGCRALKRFNISPQDLENAMRYFETL